VDGDSFAVKPYAFDDVVAALDAVQPMDWAKFLRERLDYVGDKAPLDGIMRGGWTLAYTDKPSDYTEASEKHDKKLDLMASLGLVVSTDNGGGKVSDVLWNGPAFNAGLAPGMSLVAVNDIAYSPEELKRAITEAKTGKPLRLLTRNLDSFRAMNVDYRGGLRYPHLVRSTQPDRLSQIVARRK
ncbi:MAG TPA: hypothetical protein VHL61_04610, partial [Luteimonas sp.]|nr:hypothetical protein [Luteimonas sp.]